MMSPKKKLVVGIIFFVNLFYLNDMHQLNVASGQMPIIKDI
jgi:hypothetical protein